MSASRPTPRRTSSIVCIGGGISAIALGARLKISYNFTDVAFYERDRSLGGTWYTNRYPGAACDVPAALYSFSFAQNPQWTTLHPPWHEIKEYLDNVAADYGLVDKFTFMTEVVRAEWDDEKSHWLVWVRNLDDGDEYVHECKILFSATGILVNPNIPTYPGQETFKGLAVHSARWDPSVALDGKNVAVIGNGCTAAQIVPSIVPRVSSVTQFIRTKHWIQPTVLITYTPTMLWVLKNIPLAARLFRFMIFCLAEWDFRFQGSSAFSAKQRATKMKLVEKYMRRSAPEKYHNILIPNFEIGCKRRIADPEPSYLASLNDDKVTLTDERIVELTPNGIRTSTKEYPVDVVIYATGFKTNDPLRPMEVYGRGRESIREHWKQLGGAGAYNCTSMHGFPNFFMILGPNTGTGHTSCIMASENTANYALKVLKPVLDGYASKVEPKKEAEEAYVQDVQKTLRNSVFSTGGCTNWYRDTKTDWNASLYPWNQLHFYYRCKFVKRGDWITTYTRRKPISIAMIVFFTALLATMGAFLGYSGRLDAILQLPWVHTLSVHVMG